MAAGQPTPAEGRRNDSLRPRAFDLLFALVARAGHLVSKDELLARVWPTTVVEEAALHVQVSALRKVLGADAITTVSDEATNARCW